MSQDNTNSSIAPNTAGVGFRTEAEANAHRQEHERWAEYGRQRDAEARRVANLPDPVPAKPTLRQLIPSYMSDAEGEAYLQAMIDKADGAGNPRNLDSTQVGALPIDPGILNDARSYGGRPLQPSELTDDATVAYMGTRLSVAQAVQQGLLEKTPWGEYRVPSGAAREAQQREQQQQQAQQQAAQVEALRATGDEPDMETQGAVDLVTRHVPAQAVDALVRDFVNNASLSSANLDRAAQAVGWTSDQAHGVAHKVVEGLKRQAHAATVHAGVSPADVEACWQWAQQSDPTAHAHASLALINASDARGLKALAKKYLAHKRDVARR